MFFSSKFQPLFFEFLFKLSFLRPSDVRDQLVITIRRLCFQKEPDFWDIGSCIR